VLARLPAARGRTRKEDVIPKQLEGRAAPHFTLAGADGKDVSLSSFAGRDAVVFFYPADDTPACTKEACAFRDVWKELRGAGVALVGISPDPPESHRKFAAKYKLPFTLLSDPDRKVMKKYGAWGEKVLYGNRVIGVIRSTVWVGPDGKVTRHWARVTNAAKHPALVSAALTHRSEPRR
jgi:peroxiredoxin Q/BCP